MFAVCAGRKIIGGAGLWIEPDGEVGKQAEIGEYGEGGKED